MAALLGPRREMALFSVDNQPGGHASIGGIARDPFRAGVLDCAEVELALGGGVPGDVGEPQQVRRRRGGLPAHEIIVHGWPRPTGATTSAGVDRPELLGRAELVDPVARRRPALSGEFVGDEAVAELALRGGGHRRQRWSGARRRNPGRRRVWPPSVEGVLGEVEYPAGHRDGDVVGGEMRRPTGTSVSIDGGVPGRVLPRSVPAVAQWLAVCLAVSRRALKMTCPLPCPHRSRASGGLIRSLAAHACLVTDSPRRCFPGSGLLDQESRP